MAVVLPDSRSSNSLYRASTTLLVHSGHRIRDYELLELLGQGGMGSVWKARHTRLKKLVALKLLPHEKTSDAAAVARFHREMEAVGALKHLHIIEVLDAGEENGTHYLVMEYVAGVELAELSKRVGLFPIADACELIRQTALGLQHAFEHGLVHRDIKPSNLMLARRGRIDAVEFDTIHASGPDKSGHYELKILDLGLALLHGDQPGAELTSTGQVMGTLDYIAPEQLADTHAVDIRADLYSLGCTLFRLLTTEPPFAGPSLNTAAKKMFAHSFTPAPKLLDRRPDVPAELSALVARLLEKKPDARFATPREVAAALAPFCVGHNLPALVASSAAPSSASDPFASTVIPNVAVIAPRDEPNVIEPQPITDAPHPTDLQAESFSPNGSRATEPLSSNDVDRALGSSRGAMTATLNAATPRRRPLVIVGTLLAIVLLSLFLPPFLKRDASLTETTTTNPVSPNPKSEISNSKPQTPADSDRAAAEWVLGHKGNVSVHVETLEDGKRHVIAKLADLPKGPFRVVVVTLADVTDIDAADIQRNRGGLKSVGQIQVPHCHRVNDDVISVLCEMPTLISVSFEGTGITGDGILKLLKARPLNSLQLDGRQFTNEVVNRIERSSTLNGLVLYLASDQQLRRTFRWPQVKTLGVAVLPDGVSRHRPSTWRRLAEEMPQLIVLNLDGTGLEDSDAAMLAGLPNLEGLSLHRQPGLSDTPLASLATLPKLRHISITSSPKVTPLGVADFLEAKPACQVDWDGADHRAVAEWVLSVGGKVQVAGRGAEWLDVADASRVGLKPMTARVARPEPRDGRGAAANDSNHPLPDGQGVPLTDAGRVGHDNNPVLLTGVDLPGLGTLKDADLARLADCTTLRDLQLHNTSLTGASLTHLKGLARLRVLSLAGLPIEDQHLAALSELKQLQNLTLSYTKITDAGMPALAGLNELLSLTLNGNPISSVGVESLKQPPKLASLDLTNTAVESRAIKVLCDFPRLFSVGLSNTGVTEADVKRLVQRPLPWHRLYLSNLPTVTDAILTDLRGQRELTTLELGGTSVTAAAFETFVREHLRLGMTLPTDEITAPDLRVARRILAAGGVVNLLIAAPQPAVQLSACIDFQGRHVVRIEDLPKQPFRISGIDLRPAGTKATDETLAEVG